MGIIFMYIIPILIRVDFLESFLAIGDEIDGVAVLPQALGEHLCRGGLVFDQENAHCALLLNGHQATVILTLQS